VLFVLDAHDGISETDKALIKKYTSLKIPTVLALTKIDIMPESLLIAELKELANENAEIVPVSARKNRNIKELLKVISARLPEGDKLFEQDIVSDRSEKFMVGEIMREKILLKFEKEIPHGIAVIINKFALREDGKVYEVNLDIVCEKPNHKAILIGKGGKAIKEVSSFARADMEKFLGRKVFLTTYVKIKEDWRNSASLLKELGYSENN
jgi:GTP-binding protein Era